MDRRAPQKQSELMKRLKPWEKSTGSKSRKGKQISSMNAYKNGARAASGKILCHALKLNKAFLQAMVSYKVQNMLEKDRVNELLKSRLLFNGHPRGEYKISERTIGKI